MTLTTSNQPAPDLLLGDGDRALRLSSLWSDGPLVVYLHRHFG